MFSQEQLNQAAEISKFVVESGRVESDDDGNINSESLRVEVEFECGERGLSECAEIAEAAVSLM